MKSFKHLLIFVLVAVMVANSNAQQGVFQPGDYKDGIYDKENTINRRFIPYTYLREGDVMWEKRVWRRLDMREKLNQTLYYPTDFVVSRISLPQLAIKYILSGQIIAFSDEEFQVPMEKDQVREKLVFQADSTDAVSYDAEGNEVYTREAGAIDSTWFYSNFSSLSIKEDWFFDRQKSVLEVRILGLGFNALPRGKEEAGELPYFWVYFPACRPFFAKHEVYNPKNDSERRTFEDVFWKRAFASRVMKESNVYDRSIENYTKGIDALLESDRVKNDIFLKEHDLWHF